MNFSLPGSSFRGISLARILEWVAISSSRGSSQSRDETHVSFTGRQILYHWAPREAHIWCYRDCKNGPSPPCLPASTPFALILCCFFYLEIVKVKSLSHVWLCDPMDCSPPGSSIHGIFKARVWSRLPFPSPGHLPDQGSNLSLLHYRQMLYHPKHQGSTVQIQKSNT